MRFTSQKKMMAFENLLIVGYFDPLDTLQLRTFCKGLNATKVLLVAVPGSFYEHATASAPQKKSNKKMEFYIQHTLIARARLGSFYEPTTTSLQKDTESYTQHSHCTKAQLGKLL